MCTYICIYICGYISRSYACLYVHTYIYIYVPSSITDRLHNSLCARLGNICKMYSINDQNTRSFASRAWREGTITNFACQYDLQKADINYVIHVHQLKKLILLLTIPITILDHSIDHTTCKEIQNWTFFRSNPITQ